MNATELVGDAAVRYVGLDQNAEVVLGPVLHGVIVSRAASKSMSISGHYKVILENSGKSTTTGAFQELQIRVLQKGGGGSALLQPEGPDDGRTSRIRCIL